MTTWKEFSKTVPWIATIETNNNDWTIYACLQQATKQFNAVLVVDNGSTDKTFLEIDRFVRREKPKNLQIFDLNSFDVWPDLQLDRKIKSKSSFRAFSIAKKIATKGMWVSIDPSIILFDDARIKIQSHIEEWIDPFKSYNHFNSIRVIDPWTIQKHQEFTEDNWKITSAWLGGNLSIAPNASNQQIPQFVTVKDNFLLEEKENEKIVSTCGFNLFSYKESQKNFQILEQTTKISSEINLNIDKNLMSKLRFPVVAKLIEGKREVYQCDW